MNRDCEQNREWIIALLDGETIDSERAAVMEHLLVCPGCRAEWEAVRALKEEINGLACRSSAVERRAVVAAAAPLLQKAGARRFLPFALAAAGVLLVGFSALLWPRGEAREFRSAGVQTYQEHVMGLQQGLLPTAPARIERGY